MRFPSFSVFAIAAVTHESIPPETKTIEKFDFDIKLEKLSKLRWFLMFLGAVNYILESSGIAIYTNSKVFISKFEAFLNFRFPTILSKPV